MSEKTLWGFYDGEPFMENPMLGIIGGTNPQKGKKMAVKRRKRRNVVRVNRRRHHRKNSPPRVHRARRRNTRRRRNWLTPGMVVPANPHRRHHRRRNRRMANPRRHHHRRRNPAFLGLDFPPMKTVAFGVVGFVGPSMISSTLTTAVPSLMTSITSMGTAGKYIMKFGSVALLTWLTKKFVGSAEAMGTAIGGGINIAVSLVNDFVPGILPANPLSMYLPTPPGMKAYVPVNPTLRGLRATQPIAVSRAVRQIPTAAAFPSMQTNHAVYSRFGGTPSRFMRF